MFIRYRPWRYLSKGSDQTENFTTLERINSDTHRSCCLAHLCIVGGEGHRLSVLLQEMNGSQVQRVKCTYGRRKGFSGTLQNGSEQLDEGDSTCCLAHVLGMCLSEFSCMNTIPDLVFEKAA